MKNQKECRDLKDELAKERTVLANERTFLAYVRTTIMLLASGITLIKILRVNDILRYFGWLLIPVSAVVAAIGILRYSRRKKQLKKLEPEQSR